MNEDDLYRTLSAHQVRAPEIDVADAVLRRLARDDRRAAMITRSLIIASLICTPVCAYLGHRAWDEINDPLGTALRLASTMEIAP